MRPAGSYLSPYRLVFLRAAFDDAVEFVRGRVVCLRNIVGHIGFSIMLFVRVSEARLA